MDDLARSLVSELREQGLPIELTAVTKVSVEANRLGLSRALRNLFINAATHGVRGSVSVSGRPASTVYSIAQGKHCIIFSSSRGSCSSFSDVGVPPPT